MGDFAAEIGRTGPVSVRGGGTKGDLGGVLDPGTRIVGAPTGVLHHRPEELVVVVGAGTPVVQLEAELALHGQHTGLDGPPGATVGGVLAAGRTGVHGLGLGPVRDVLLGASTVDARGDVLVVGGATVKNVSGFDLCRTLVGSLGTLALFGEVTLRTRPLWPATVWLSGPADPTLVVAAASCATSVLWDGRTAWVHLAGHRGDLDDQVQALVALGCGTEVDGPPRLPSHRHSVDPAVLGEGAPPVARESSWVAEVGVGIVHADAPRLAAEAPARVLELHRAVKARFDPTGRLNPGRSPVAAGARMNG